MQRLDLPSELYVKRKHIPQALFSRWRGRNGRSYRSERCELRLREQSRTNQRLPGWS